MKPHKFVSTERGAIILSTLRINEIDTDKSIACVGNIRVGKHILGKIENDGTGELTRIAYNNDAYKDLLEGHVEGLPDMVIDGKDVHWTVPLYLSALVDMYRAESWLYKRTIRGKKTFFAEGVQDFIDDPIVNDRPTTWRCLDRPYNDEAHEYIVKNTASHGGDDVFIYNREATLYPGIIFPTEKRAKRLNRTTTK